MPDLQRVFGRNPAAEIIEKQVKNGEVKIVYRDFIIISEESIPAGEAALAAGEQGKGWSFIELFYRNQGEERSGYVTDEFIEGIAEGAGVPDMKKFNEERKSGKFKKKVEATTEQASKFGFTGTPSFAVEGPSSNGIELLNTPGSTEAIVERIEQRRAQQRLGGESGGPDGACARAPLPPLPHQVDITKIIVRWI